MYFILYVICINDYTEENVFAKSVFTIICSNNISNFDRLRSQCDLRRLFRKKLYGNINFKLHLNWNSKKKKKQLSFKNIPGNSPRRLIRNSLRDILN